MKLQRMICVVVVFAMAWPVMGGAQEKGYWRAASQTAKSITGDVSFTKEKVTINLSSYWIAQIRTVTPEEARAAFGVESGDGGSGNLYRLSIPGDMKFLRRNTLCGGEDVQWAVTYVARHRLAMDLFSGTHMPVLTAAGLTDAPNFCGTFSYVK